MTDHPSIPVVPGGDPTLSQLMPQPGPPKPKAPRWVLPVVVLAVILVGGLATTTVVLLTRADATAGAAPTTRPAVAQPPTVVDAQPRTYPTPKASDFSLTVKVVKKNCFGSAGCNVTYGIEVVYNGLPFEPGSDWDVTYEVTGGEDPQINTFGITGTSDGFSYSPPRDQLIQTAKSSSVLAIKVTSVTRA